MAPRRRLSTKKIGGTYSAGRYRAPVSKRGLSDRQIARVLAALQRRLVTVHAENVTALAQEIGISQPALWQLLNRRTRPSYGTAETLARLEGIPVESLLVAPRERAAQIAREGNVPETAIQRVLDEPDDETYRPVLYWIDRMRAAAILDTPPTPPATPDVPVRSRRRR